MSNSFINNVFFAGVFLEDACNGTFSKAFDLGKISLGFFSWSLARCRSGKWRNLPFELLPEIFFYIMNLLVVLAKKIL